MKEKSVTRVFLRQKGAHHFGPKKRRASKFKLIANKQTMPKQLYENFTSPGSYKINKRMSMLKQQTPLLHHVCIIQIATITDPRKKKIKDYRAKPLIFQLIKLYHKNHKKQKEKKATLLLIPSVFTFYFQFSVSYQQELRALQFDSILRLAVSEKAREQRKNSHSCCRMA